MERKTLLTTKEAAEFLNINEKMVYTLISEKGLPATKVTGKWLFPRHLVENWLENHTINYPETSHLLPHYHGLLIIIGSNDILLDRLISLFNRLHPEYVAVFGNVGSMLGIKALNSNLCHVASSHLLQDDEQEYNFDFASQEFGVELPVLVNFCRREQGLVVAKGNPRAISSVSDLGKPGVTIVNRPEGTGTRLLLDKELYKVNLRGTEIKGYNHEVRSHLDVALEVLSDRADAGLAIKAVAGLLGLDFIPLRWERYDLLIQKEQFFEQAVQLFLGLLNESEFRKIAEMFEGYDLSLCGKMIFPQQSGIEK
jgi:excisionase family DNA binding protein